MAPVQFDQLALRRLENGDYCRITKERYGTRVLIELGNAECDDDGQAIFVWRWAIELGMSGLADLQHDLAVTMRALCQTGDAVMAQQHDKLRDLVEIVDAERSKHIGDHSQAEPLDAV